MEIWLNSVFQLQVDVAVIFRKANNYYDNQISTFKQFEKQCDKVTVHFLASETPYSLSDHGNGREDQRNKGHNSSHSCSVKIGAVEKKLQHN